MRRHTVRHLGPFFLTFHELQTSSSPDKVLSNPSFSFAYAISPGSLTTSDHLPMVIDISSSPILIPIPPTYSYHNTNWDNFKADNQLDMTDQPDITYANLENIDEALEHYSPKTVVDRHIPKRTYRTIACPRPFRTTQMTRIQYQALRDQATRTGWTYDNFRRFTRLRQTLLESRQEESSNCWSQALARLASSYRNPRRFWKDIKKTIRPSNRT